jgi:hypothetical protein
MKSAAMMNIDAPEADPTQQMLADLHDEIQQLRAKKYEVVIAGDWNINKRDDRAKGMWTAWCKKVGVHDTYTHETGAPASWAQMAAGTVPPLQFRLQRWGPFLPLFGPIQWW